MLPLLAGTVCLDGADPDPALVERLGIAVRNQTTARQRQVAVPGGWFSAGVPPARPGRLTRHLARDSETDGWVLAFDGRLTERTALIDMLDLAGRGPAPDDAELALAAFARWGDAAPGHLNGRFAIALWQGARRRLVLAVDHMRQARIYLHRNGPRITFGSTLRLVRALPEVPATLDEDMLGLFLADVSMPTHRTFFAAIDQIPPATVLAIDARGQSETEHWSVDWSRRIRLARDEDYVEAGRELVDRAVARALPASGPVVSMLSGGLDSTMVTATAARLVGARGLTALTTVPPDGAEYPEHRKRFGDERAHAEAVARMYPGIRHEIMPAVTPHPMETDPRRFFAVLNVPWRNVSNIGWFVPMHDRAALLGSEAILVGSAGNLGFSYNGTDGLYEMVKGGHPLRALREARIMARQSPNGSTLGTLRKLVLRPLFSPAAQHRIDRARGRRHPWINAIPLRKEIWQQMDIDREWVRAGRGYGQGMAGRRSWLHLMQASSGDLRPGLEHLTGIHVRDPLSDKDLLAFFFALPPEQYLRNGVTRFIARRMAADRLPPEITGETRRGRQSPEWFHRLGLYRDQLAAEVDAMAASPTVGRLLDVPRLQRLVRDWPETATDADFSDYGAALARGAYAASFIRWVEGRND
ncbi:MAG: asparagine synthase-related protein [Pseudomonadota bacterium]|nr:asparagine synthase-related protein [Pseudomonadota bacterium]